MPLTEREIERILDRILRYPEIFEYSTITNSFEYLNLLSEI